VEDVGGPGLGEGLHLAQGSSCGRAAIRCAHGTACLRQQGVLLRDGLLRPKWRHVQYDSE
jgi:hypothetical protein